MKTCAVVVGIGDGTFCRALADRYGDLVTIVLPGEEPIPGLPGSQFVVGHLADAAEVVSRRFSKHQVIVTLPDTDFFDQHPCGGDPAFRHDFCLRLYRLIGERPLWMGDSVTDCLQGVYHIAMAGHLLAGAPRPDEIPKLDCPALCVASGPSVAKHLDAIRALQDHALIVCADSALEPLLKAGIRPHVVTPLERVPDILRESFPAERYPGIIFAGTPAVHHGIAPKFDRHILIPGSDLLFTWTGCAHEHQFFYGQSTGVLSVALALRLTTGKVYLIGHDLCYADAESHWGAVNPAVKTHCDEGDILVPGNDGEQHRARAWWDTFRQELSDLALEHRRVVNLNAHDRTGALIHGALAEPLPDVATLAPYPGLVLPPVNEARAEALAEKIRRLPKDARRIMAKLSSNRIEMTDINMADLCPNANKDFFAYILRSIVGGTSMDHFTGRPGREAATYGAQAIRNALRAHMGTLEVMARAPIAEAACIA